MSVLIISNYFEPEMGAASRRVTSMARSFRESGVDVNVICPLPNYPEGRVFKGYRFKLKKTEEIDGIRVTRLWVFPSNSKNPFLRVLSMISFVISLCLYMPFRKRSTVSKVIVQSPPLFVSAAAVFLAKTILKKPVVLNVSDLWPKSALELGVIGPGKFYSILLKLESYIYHNSNVILGQSLEIIDHIANQVDKPTFLYRNLPRETFSSLTRNVESSQTRVVYAGLLGFAQGVLKICSEIDFKKLDIEFHIFGKGMEEEKIKSYIKDNPSKNIFFHGSFKPRDAYLTLTKFDAAIVPLTNRIYGAVPSKIFELVNFCVPIIFGGGGEGAKLVEKYGLGLTFEPGSMDSLEKTLVSFKHMNEGDLKMMNERILQVGEEHFAFNKQFDNLLIFLNSAV